MPVDPPIAALVKAPVRRTGEVGSIPTRRTSASIHGVRCSWSSGAVVTRADGFDSHEHPHALADDSSEPRTCTGQSWRRPSLQSSGARVRFLPGVPIGPKGVCRRLPSCPASRTTGSVTRHLHHHSSSLRRRTSADRASLGLMASVPFSSEPPSCVRSRSTGRRSVCKTELAGTTPAGISHAVHFGPVVYRLGRQFLNLEKRARHSPGSPARPLACGQASGLRNRVAEVRILPGGPRRDDSGEARAS